MSENGIRETVLRTLGLFGAYEVAVWFGAKIAPPANIYTTRLVLSAAGLTVLAVYLLWVFRIRSSLAIARTGALPDKGQKEPALAGSQTGHVRPPTVLLQSFDIPERSLFLVISPHVEEGESPFRRLELPAPFILQYSQAGAGITLWSIGRDDRDGNQNEALLLEITGRLEDMAMRISGIRNSLEPRPLRNALDSFVSGIVPSQAKLRGLVLFFPLDQLTKEQWRAQADSVADLLKTVGSVFEAHFPVYLALSQAQSAPYFDEFAQNLQGEERRRAFGITFSHANGGPAEAARISPQLDRLFQRLAALRPYLLNREMNSRSKPGIYEHPREWLRLHPRVVDFLEHAIGAFRQDTIGPFLRGYFVTGTPSRVADPTMTVVYSDTRPTENLFLVDLLTKAIAADKLRAYRPRTTGRKRLWRTVFAAAGLSLFVWLTLSTNSWIGNRHLVAQAREVVASSGQLQQTPAQIAGLPELEKLDGLRQMVHDLRADSASPPWALRWGLYQGNQLLAPITDFYFDRFRLLLLDPIRVVLRGQLAAVSVVRPILSYDSARSQLRLYQMIHGRRCSVDPNFVKDNLLHEWTELGTADPRTHGIAAKQFEFYANELTARDPYELQAELPVVENAQRYLQENHGADQLYAGIIQETNQRRPSARLVALLANEEDRRNLERNYRTVMSGPLEVEAAFGRDNIAFIEERLETLGSSGGEDTCLVGTGMPNIPAAQRARMTADLRDKYDEAYQARWKRFLAETNLLAFPGPAEAAKRLNVITQNQSPLLAVFALVADNTGPAETPPHGSNTPASAPGGASASQSAPMPRMLAVFRPVHRVMPPGSRQSWKNEANDTYVQALRTLEDAMRDLGSRPSDPPTIETAQKAADAADRLVDRIKDGFGNDTNGVDHEVERLLRKPIFECRRFIRPPDPAAGINQTLQGFCREWSSIQSKFPFNPKAKDEVSQSDFERIFRPENGALWVFQKQGAVLRSPQGRWERGRAAGDLTLNEGFLQFLTRMATISDAFFQGPNGPFGRQITVHINATPGLNTSLRIGGEPGKNSQFSWPGGNPQEGFRLVANSAVFRYSGVWGIYKMIENADERIESMNRVTLSKTHAEGGVAEPLELEGGKPAKIDLTLPDVPGGIRRSFFSGLTCPGQAAHR